MTPITRSSLYREIPIPLTVDEWALLKAPFPMIEAQWNQMLAVLTAMKPALVTPPQTLPPHAPLTHDDSGDPIV